MSNYKELAGLDYLEQVKNRFYNPKMAALFSPGGGGGSHYILHKLQGHPNLVALGEHSFVTDIQGGTVTSDLKNYFTKNHFPSFLLACEE